jgi:signal transduction histidine kinase
MDDDVTERARAEGQLGRALEALKRSDEQRRVLHSRLVDAQVEERRRVATAINDEAIETMSAISMRIVALRRRAENPSMIESLEALEEAVSLATQRLRRLAWELDPPALAHAGGLRTALREYLESLEADDGIVCTLEGQVTEPVAFEARTVCFRIAQEALWNVRKHAKASRVDVLVESRDAGIFARIRDDGEGFWPGEPGPAPDRHLALASMKERAEMSGGWLEVHSEPGRGTTIEYWVPDAAPGERPIV